MGVLDLGVRGEGPRFRRAGEGPRFRRAGEGPIFWRADEAQVRVKTIYPPRFS